MRTTTKSRPLSDTYFLASASGSTGAAVFFPDPNWRRDVVDGPEGVEGGGRASPSASNCFIYSEKLGMPSIVFPDNGLEGIGTGSSAATIEAGSTGAGFAG